MKTSSDNTEMEKGFGRGTTTSHVKSHANDPFVLKKVEEATATIKKFGLPGQEKK